MHCSGANIPAQEPDLADFNRNPQPLLALFQLLPRAPSLGRVLPDATDQGPPAGFINDRKSRVAQPSDLSILWGPNLLSERVAFISANVLHGFRYLLVILGYRPFKPCQITAGRQRLLGRKAIDSFKGGVR